MRKATIRFVMSVCLSALNNSAPTEQIFMKIHIWAFFEKTLEKIQVPLKSDKNNGYFTWRPIYIFFFHISLFAVEWEMFWEKVVKKIKTHILCSATFFPENRAVYEIMWENIVERVRPQMTIWRMRIASWMPKATNTHSQYVILIAFPLQQRLDERPSVLRHTHIAWFVIYDFLIFAHFWRNTPRA